MGRVAALAGQQGVDQAAPDRQAQRLSQSSSVASAGVRAMLYFSSAASSCWMDCTSVRQRAGTSPASRSLILPPGARHGARIDGDPGTACRRKFYLFERFRAKRLARRGRRAYAPFADIAVDVHLPQRRAA